LLEPVERLDEVASHAVHAVRVANRRLNPHVLVQVTLHERVLHVDVVDGVALDGRGGDGGAKSGVLGDGRKHFVVVDPMHLAVALNDQARLVALDVAVGVALDLEDPLGGDELGAVWWWRRLPRAVGLEGGHLLVHGGAPLVGLR
jgi:hypothetical protein